MTCVACRRPVVSGKPHSGCAPYLAIAPYVLREETRGRIDRTGYVPEAILTVLLLVLIVVVLHFAG